MFGLSEITLLDKIPQWPVQYVAVNAHARSILWKKRSATQTSFDTCICGGAASS
jgi:hypothetical protein